MSFRWSPSASLRVNSATEPACRSTTHRAGRESLSFGSDSSEGMPSALTPTKSIGGSSRSDPFGGMTSISVFQQPEVSCLRSTFNKSYRDDLFVVVRNHMKAESSARSDLLAQAKSYSSYFRNATLTGCWKTKVLSFPQRGHFVTNPDALCRSECRRHSFGRI